jgi:CDP-diglyceride synthetase
MIVGLYITMLPLILSGIVNMLFVKTPIYKKYKIPIDCNKNWIDGKRIFGDNKTFIGFISMIVFCIIFQILWGYVGELCQLNSQNDWYLVYSNSIRYNVVSGFLVGLFYMLFELPNSFIKRRINIIPGKTDKGIKGVVFFVIDQIDSLIGVFLVLKLLSGIAWSKYFLYLLVGGLTHITINLMLWLCGIRRNL